MQVAAQLELFQAGPGRRTLPDLSAWLNRDVRMPIRVTLNRNRVSLASVRFQPDGHVHCGLHEQFLHAPQPVLQALKTFCTSRRRSAWYRVDDFAQTIQPSPRTFPAEALTSRGRHHDLARLYAEVNRTHYAGKADCAITWGRRGHRRRGTRYRSIEFGSYVKSDNLVRINPLLDNPRVPEAFLRYVIFHEILHAFIPPVRRQGRWQYHPPAFREREKEYPGFAEMKDLCGKLLDELR